MLPQNEEQVRAHADLGESGLALLDAFRTSNPQLVPVEWDGRGILCDQFWHFAFLNHRQYSSGMPPECCSSGRVTSRITDHSELWQDRETQDLVHIAHPYCDGTDEEFWEGARFLATRGLNCVMSEASWYYPGSTTLVVAARPRTLDRISLIDVLDGHYRNEEWDTKRIVAMQKAGEQVDADRWFAEAQTVEADGDFRRATLLFVHATHTERTGRFHRQAVRCLREAGRLLRHHYNDAVLDVVESSSLTHAEVADVRKVFGFAGMEVPDWLERIWRNGRRQSKCKWGYRIERSESTTGWVEYYRCVVCEEWLEEGEKLITSLGYMHLNRSCLARVAGVSQESSE